MVIRGSDLSGADANSESSRISDLCGRWRRWLFQERRDVSLAAARALLTRGERELIKLFVECSYCRCAASGGFYEGVRVWITFRGRFSVWASVAMAWASNFSEMKRVMYAAMMYPPSRGERWAAADLDLH